MYIIKPTTYDEAKKITENGGFVYIILKNHWSEYFWYVKLVGEEFAELDAYQCVEAWVTDPETGIFLATEFERLTTWEKLDFPAGKYMFTNTEPAKVKDFEAIMEKYNQ